MRPEIDLIDQDVKGIKLQAVVEKMNKRIEVLLDEDHMIGHSYFLKLKSVDAVKDVWFKQIMPLINEYFYGDWDKIMCVLGKYFVKEIDTNDLDLGDYLGSEHFYRFRNVAETSNEDFVNEINKLA